MKKIFFLCYVVLFFPTYYSHAQNVGSVGNAINIGGGGVFFNTVGGGMHQFRPNSKLKLEQGAYLFREWNQGIAIGMAKQQIPFDRMNYNIETQSLEIERNKKKEFFTPDMIKGFVIQSTKDSTQNITFISLKNTKGVENKIPLFYQVIADGKIALLLNYEVVMTNGNYNPALNLGEKSKIVVQNTAYYYDGKEIIVLKKTKKGLLKLFANQKEKMEIFIENKDLDNFEDLKAIFTYYNSL
jgi:hypothetical protein